MKHFRGSFRLFLDIPGLDRSAARCKLGESGTPPSVSVLRLSLGKSKAAPAPPGVVSYQTTANGTTRKERGHG
ncbi:MAG: hypothetical protein AMJ46_14065 [Latescibacteria bacterium DG_63]|nr:MAG: hypothetical protein AMJ46_14065 [Latescibacteria bacterium DG_63]